MIQEYALLFLRWSSWWKNSMGLLRITDIVLLELSEMWVLQKFCFACILVVALNEIFETLVPKLYLKCAEIFLKRWLYVIVKSAKLLNKIFCSGQCKSSSYQGHLNRWSRRNDYKVEIQWRESQILPWILGKHQCWLWITRSSHQQLF